MPRIAPAWLLGLLLMPLASAVGPAAAAGASTGAVKVPPSIVVADVDLVELAPVDERYDQAEDAARAARLSQRIRAAVVHSNRYRVLDHGSADRVPPHRYTDCKACLVGWARQRGADYVLVSWVQKESRLILMVNMALIDVAHPEQVPAGGSVDLRGDTDETWLVGASQMLDRTIGVAISP